MAVCYLDDLLKLPALIFSDHPFAFVHRRSTLDMLLVLAVWFLVSSATRRILNRVRHLERFMRVCAWCRRISFKGEWISMEEFMRQGFELPTTHGICQDCLHQQQDATQKTQQANPNAVTTTAT